MSAGPWASGGVTLLALGALALAVLALAAWARSHEGRYALLAAGFGAIAAGAAYVLTRLFSTAGTEGLLAVLAGSTAVGLFLLYFAAVKRE